MTHPSDRINRTCNLFALKNPPLIPNYGLLGLRPRLNEQRLRRLMEDAMHGESRLQPFTVGGIFGAPHREVQQTIEKGTKGGG